MDNTENNVLVITISVTVLALAILVLWLLNNHKKRKRATLLGQQKTREEQAKFELERQKTLITKYGEELGLKIIAKSYFEGMTKEQVLEAKQMKPDKIEIEEQKSKETWIYGHKSSSEIFVFENEILVKFKV